MEEIRETPLRALAQFVLKDKRVLALAATMAASLAVNVADTIPFVGPAIEALADVGFETIAMVIAASILRRDRKPLTALLVLGGIGVVKAALDGLNLLPEVGGMLETAAEVGLDLTQLWFLKEIVAPAPTEPGAKRPVIDVEALP
ncbi:MAG: hypothetical protein U0166_18635 [Acidobacteriota bacterium]